MEKDLEDTLYLMGCALNSIKADPERLKQMNFEKIYHISSRHMISSIVVTSLIDSGIYDALPMSSDLSKKWIWQREQTIRRTMLMDHERNKLFSFMESAGIGYMPLKGIILKDLYPQIGMRQMADNDILFDEKRKDDLKKYMDEAGYTCKDNPGSNHLVFSKAPFYSFEMHKLLVNEKLFHRWSSYNSEAPKHLIKNDGDRYGYHFSDEDFYIFMIIHSYKHYSVSGTGLRTLADWYIYLCQKKSMNWNYINNEMEKYGVSDFERTGRTLSEKIFSADGINAGIDFSALSASESDMLIYVYGSGTYGTIQNRCRNDLKALFSEEETSQKNKIKIRYYWNRIVPPLSWYEANTPYVYQHRYLVPFYVIGRLVRAVIFKRSRIKVEINTLNKELKEKQNQ